MFSYAPLAATLHRKRMSRTELQKKISASPATFAKIGKDEHVSMEVLDKICTALGCGIADVIEHIPDHNEESTPAE